MPTGVYVRTKEMRTGKAPRTENWRRNSSLARIGKAPGNKGMHYSEEVRKGFSLRQRGNTCKKGKIVSEIGRKNISKAVKMLWEDSEYRDMMVSRIILGQKLKPNKAEQKLIALIEKSNLPFKYVGDGYTFIAGKCPDFLNIDGKKQLIELFGDFWHKGETGEDRIAHFAKYGFRTLIVWEHELKNENVLADRIKEFLNG